ncbi:MAG: hypothetical protein VB959_04945 [Rhodospirillales bacterium]|jgi:uncharacterized membrane protein YdbT with pleckstrin-like domain
METVSDAVKFMFFVYGLAAVLSLVIAWIIKMIFVAVQYRKARAEARNGSAPDTDSEAAGDDKPARQGSA